MSYCVNEVVYTDPTDAQHQMLTTHVLTASPQQDADYPTIGVVEHKGVRDNGQLDDIVGVTMCIAPGDVMQLLRDLGDRLRGVDPEKDDRTVVLSLPALRDAAARHGIGITELDVLLHDAAAV